MKTKVHFLQTYIVLLSGIAATLLPVSCSEADSLPAGVTPDAPAGEKDRVEILIPRNITRTYISEDEYEDQAPDHKDDDYEDYAAKVGWNDNDKLTLWAKSESGTRTDAITFTYLGPSYDMENRWTLFYSKEVKVPDDRESLYTYYAVSPVPDNADDRYAYFTIPAEQGGRYDRGYKGAVPDILWAPPVKGAKCLMPDVRNLINFRFEHKLHALKIIVPEVPFTNGIKQMRIEFPYDVAGKLKVDLESGATSLAEGTNAITLTFDDDRRLMPNDTCWVFVAPAPNGGEEVTGDVHFTAANADGTQFTFPTPHEAGSGTFKYNELTGGRITPVKLHLTLRPQVDFEVKVTDHSRLGEPIINITSLTLPEGYSAPSLILGNRTVHPTSQGSETFTVKLFADEVERLNGETLTAVLESEHAEGFEVSNTVANKSLSLSAPYLYAEDFSSTTQSNELNHNPTDISHSSGSWEDNLSTYGFPSGWSGGRCGVQQATAVGVWNRSERFVGQTNLRGVLDSPTMSHLKAGATVKLKISFNYSMNHEGNSHYKQPYFSVGVYPNSTNISSIISDNVGTSQLDNGFGNNITAIGTEGYTNDFTGSYTHIDKSWDATTGTICTRDSRFVWSVYRKDDADWRNGYWNDFLYLDNIKVSIVP